MTGYLAVVVVALFLSGAGWFLYSRDGWGRRGIDGDGCLRTDDAPSDGASGKVLILTAAVGGGHEAAGRTVQAELKGAGRIVVMADGLRILSPALAGFLNRVYCNQARNTPRALGAIFAVTSRRSGAAVVRLAVSLLFANRLLRVLREEKLDLIVSTYPLVTAALGYLRDRGKLETPAAAVVADYGVHPLWVAPGVDLHLVVSRHSAELTEHAGGEATVVRIPVAPGFYSTPAREEARALLGLPADAFVALVVGGVLGIGDLEGTARCAAESGAYTVVVTGNNTGLKARLEAKFGSRENVRILGWREDMPILMAASDCLIQNAGGMTCTEAIEVGLPIVMFDPIPGHGKLNARVMELAGAVSLVHDAEELRTLLRSAARRETFLPAPKKEAAAPAVGAVLGSLAGGVTQLTRPRRVLRPVLASVSLLMLLSCLAFAPAGVAVDALAVLLASAAYVLYPRRTPGKSAVSSKSLPRGGDAPPDKASGKVLILTAAAGGGHEAAGRALRDELEEAGHSVVIKDGLRTMSRTLDWLLVRGYADQVRHAPGSLGAIFAVTSRRAGAAAVQAVVSLLFAHRLLGVIREEKPDLVISTYPLVAAALGRLRKSGKLGAPAVAVIPDYGSHALWVTPSVDVHLVVSSRSAELVSSAGGKAVVVRLPVAPGFRHVPTPEKAREILGLPPAAFVALVVGGAWGIGDLGGISQRVAESGAYAVIVTGNNAELKVQLEKELGSRENVRILGWTEDMPILMAASDCLIQNGGAMTCLEAMEMGLPILFFEPISGHGELNARVMEQAGAARWVRTPAGLTALLRSLARGYASLPAPNGERAAPKASVVLDALIGAAPRQVVPGRRVVVRPRPALAGMAAIILCSWLAFSSPGIALAAKGLRLYVPGYDPTPGEVSLGVRVTDPATAAAVQGEIQQEQMPVTVFANARAAEGLDPAAGLTFGVAEEPGKEGAYLPWRARSQSQEAAVEIRQHTGERPEYFLPANRTSLAAYAEAPPYARPVVSERTGWGAPYPGLLIVDTSSLDPEAARQKVGRALREIREENLRCVPLAEL